MRSTESRLQAGVFTGLVAFLMLFVSPAVVYAAEAPSMEEAEKREDVEETRSDTRHVLRMGDEDIAYTATAGTLVLRDDEGKAEASVFYVAYVRDGVDDPADRPVTFSFNGGPGSAAVWVHFGAFGPKKVLADKEGMPEPPPGRLIPNPYSILDVSDLVFIDPVSTGWSRAAPGVDAKKFHNLRGDVESVGEFMRLWLTRNERWASPKFIAGESYGTTRAAGLALHLQERHGLYLNGLVMISTILNWQNQEMHPGNDTAYAIHLPSYAAAAWYHGRLDSGLPSDLRTLLDEVERFSLHEYAPALILGDWLPDERRKEIARKVARYSGLSVDYVEDVNLRIAIWRFVKELLRDEGKTVGRLDTRFTGWDRDSGGETFEFDPSGEAVNVGYVTLLNDYMRRELGYETDLPYRSSAGLWRNWHWNENSNRYVNVAEDLRQAMTRNPELRVLFTAGYYDLATPYFDTPYTAAHLALPEELRDNVEITYYEAGHMMYIREADHDKFRNDIVGFIERSIAP